MGKIIMQIYIKAEVNGKQVKIFSYYPVEDTEDDNIDIFVEIDDVTYSGQIYSWKNIESVINKGDMPCYFYDRHGIILQTLSNENIIAAIEEMVESGEIKHIFCRQI